MSHYFLKKEVESLLGFKKPGVMIIRGRWGVGKTYAWRGISKEILSGDINASKYSYISLFGVNSVSDMKTSIYENMHNLNGGISFNGCPFLMERFGCFVDSFPAIFNALNKIYVIIRDGFKYVYRFIKFHPIVAEASEKVVFKFLKNAVICIDDFDRLGSDLNIKDVFGLISHLKENHGCSFIVIVDDERVESDFKKFIEKVVDLDFYFNPEVKDLVPIYFNKEYEFLGEYLISLGVNNLRVHEKILRFYQCINLSLNKYSDDVRREVSKILCLIVWAKECSSYDNKVPTLDYIDGYSSYAYSMGDDVSGKEWHEVLKRYGFRIKDDLYIALKEYVMSGHLSNIDNIEKVFIEMDGDVIRNDIRSKYNHCWNVFHDGFSDNWSVISKGFIDFFEEFSEYLNGSDLSQVVFIFKKMNDGRYNDLIEVFMDKNSSKGSSFFDISNSGMKIDEDVADKFSSYLQSFFKELDDTSMLNILLNDDILDADFKFILSNQSAEDIYLLLVGAIENMDPLLVDKLIRRLVSFYGITDGVKSVSEKTLEALKRIGEEQPLNGLRFRRYEK